jgi:hypothetical protein
MAKEKVGSSVAKKSGNNIDEVHLITGMFSSLFSTLLFVLFSKKVKLPLIESAPIGKLITTLIKRVKYSHG